MKRGLQVSAPFFLLNFEKLLGLMEIVDMPSSHSLPFRGGRVRGGDRI